MQEDEEIIKIPEHISYKEYQKKVSKSSDGIAIFVSAFFILLLLFLGIAKQLSPEIDVSIGDGDNMTSDSIGIDKANVDERLKFLQMEDSSQDNMFDESLEEKVVIPDKSENGDKTVSEDVEELKEKTANPKPEETAASAPRIPAQTLDHASDLTVKVVVGYYSTREQAEVAKGILAESGLSISPFVKTIGGGYTVQVGSFSTRDKAQSLANDLLRNNYPAKVIVE